MICDNCGANIDKNEEYCPNCGMELLTPKPKKKKYHNEYRNPKRERRENLDDKEHFNYSKTQSIEKPIKEKYIGYAEPESPDYSHYDEDDYEDREHYPETRDYDEAPTEKKGNGIGTIVLLLFIALVFGFIVGLFIFSNNNQFIPQIPGFNT
ncbi:zinc-ribbon domain-containing protein [Methanobacterium sp. ACI-7]|uniref:zinc-ribbon domain-containing protein n=1 Tax=unclassified Methanobacterium TaxID=2627676 RepID=UPI0039C2DD99